ncbi:MAG: post-COAP-1 domain-containing protein [Gaiellaceae bacterium]
MRRRRAWASLAVAITVAGLALFASSARAQAPPPTLTGEEFVAAPDVTTNCNPDGNSTVTFSASGDATGPYPGTFTEVGTATIGPQTLSPGGGQSIGTLLTFDAVFTIQSDVGDVTGTKTLAFPVTNPATEVAIGQCNTFQDVELEDVIDRFTVRYQAQISTSAGDFADRGLIPLVAVQRQRVLEDPLRITFDSFIEDFLSDLTATEPLTSPGQATGGGQIPGDVTFGFTAKSDQNGVKGNCTVIDRTRNVMVKCLDATTYFQTATHATFNGNATVNGTKTTYRITVDDTAEPGTGADTFTITTASGYTATGVLTQGNIQVHN